MSKFKTFVLAAVLALGGVTGAAVIDAPFIGVPRAAAADANYYVEYTKYMVKKGITTKLFSGKIGPYDRREAQSRVDAYNADDTTVNGVRYYFVARVR